MMKRFGKFRGVLCVVDGEGVGLFFIADEVVDVLLSFHFLKVKGFIRKENKFKGV